MDLSIAQESHFSHTHKKLRNQTPQNRTKITIMSRPRRAYSFPMSIFLSLALILLHTHFSICNGVSVLDLNSLKMGEIERMGQRVCSSNKIGECLTEIEMDSEINRRVLAMQKKYISYETLKRDMIPCARAGAPYYNCHVGPANPYSRGCEVITGCRGTIKGTNN